MTVPTFQPSNLPPTSPDLVRVFVGLWPGPAVRARLVALAGQWTWPAAALRVGEQRLHMTLHFLGDMPRSTVPTLADSLNVTFFPFDLMLDRTEVWRNGTATLCPAEIPPALSTLQQALAESLSQRGILPEARSFKPHVTFARRADTAIAPAHFSPVRWRVMGYTLVEARLAEAGTSAVYRQVRHYPASVPPGQENLPVEWPVDQFQSGPIPF